MLVSQKVSRVLPQAGLIIQSIVFLQHSLVCFKIYFKKALCTWVFCLHVHVCTICMPDTHEGQWWLALDFLDWSYTQLVSCYVNARNGTWVPCKSSHHSSPDYLL